MSERVEEYVSREARAHLPAVGIADGYASLPAVQWVAHAQLFEQMLKALREIESASFVDVLEYASFARSTAREALPSHLTDLGQEDR